MIADTFTIRKVDGHLIVGAHEPNAPIQVVQQLSDTLLNVHLKNGFNYKHECVKNDIISTLLEMFGYQRFTITVEASAWLRDSHVHVKSKAARDLTNEFNKLVTGLYEFEPNIKRRVTKAKSVYSHKLPHPSYVSDYTWEFELTANASHIIELENYLKCPEVGKHFLCNILNFDSLTELERRETGCSVHNAHKQLCGGFSAVYYRLKE